jgi:hypothetical protein
MITQVTALSYSLTITDTEGKLSASIPALVEGDAPPSRTFDSNAFTAEVKSSNGKKLFTTQFLIETIPQTALDPRWFNENGTQIFFPNDTEKDNKTTTLVLLLPYFRNGESIEIRNSTSEIQLSINIAKYATCNMNGICDSKESFNQCPEDCKSGLKDSFCDGIKDGKCDPDCLSSQDSDCNLPSPVVVPSNQGVKWLAIIVILIVIIIIALKIAKKI